MTEILIACAVGAGIAVFLYVKHVRQGQRFNTIADDER